MGLQCLPCVYWLWTSFPTRVTRQRTWLLTRCMPPPVPRAAPRDNSAGCAGYVPQSPGGRGSDDPGARRGPPGDPGSRSVISWPVVTVFLFWTMFTELSHHSTHPLARLVSLGFLPGRLYPEHHLAHHLHGRCNYGENWIFWDLCMGTLSQFEQVDAPETRSAR